MSGINRIIKQTDYQFTMVPNQAVRDPDLTSNAFRLLAYLLSHENGYELVYQQIMRQTDLGKFAIQKALDLLKEKGFVQVEQSRRPDGSFGGYDFILLDPYQGESTGSGHSTPGSFRHGTTRPLKEDKDSKKIKEKEDHQKGFEIFWQKYPRHENKATAIKAYEKAIKKTSQDELLKKLDQYIAHNEKNEIKFAFAATWLNQERWLDEFDAIVVRQDKSKEHTKQMLAEMAELEKHVGTVPRCKHDKNPALCRDCYTQK
jgi:hypothetical protein